MNHHPSRALTAGFRTFGTGLLAFALLCVPDPPLSVGQSDLAAPSEARAQLTKTFDRDIRPFLATYCVACHGPSKPKADLNLSLFGSGDAALAKPGLWKDCAAKVQSLEMPPRKEPKQPGAEERARFGAWVAGFRSLHPKDPGRGTLRRLSQVEYANTLVDLLGVDPRIADEIPRDETGPGFNSSIPPLLMEKYLATAEAALEGVIKPDQLKAKWAAGQLGATLEGKKVAGSPGGLERKLSGNDEVSAVFVAPVEGAYSITLRAGSDRAFGREPCRVAVRLNGESAGEIKVASAAGSPAASSVTCKLSPGIATLSVAMANPSVEVTADHRKSPSPKAEKPEPRTLVLESIEIVGPAAAPATPMQRKLFVALPGKDLTPRDAARKIVQTFMRRAFRRPPRPPEIEALLKVFDLADRKGAVFSESVRLMLKATLVSPAFLYLTSDEGSTEGPDGTIVPLGDHQLASRLSYLFWSTMPDDELAGLADAGKLKEPSITVAQIRRLIADPRSRTLFDGFGAAWLGLDRIHELEVDEKKFPLMTKTLRPTMGEEAALLFDAILRGDRSLVDFIDPQFTFMNETLARIYGMEASVKGSKLVRVPLSDPNRGGILTLPGVLAVTSLPNRTSPVKRGRWVLEQILGQSPPAPPADVPPLEKQDAGSTGLTLRQKMERHRSTPACFGCHQTIDPIGFGLENFDVIGRWRDTDENRPVDAKGELPGGATFSGPAELKRILIARKDEFCRNLVKRILAHALCRSLSGYDEVVADDIADEVARDGYKFQTVWIKVATSYPFLNRKLSR